MLCIAIAGQACQSWDRRAINRPTPHACPAAPLKTIQQAWHPKLMNRVAMSPQQITESHFQQTPNIQAAELSFCCFSIRCMTACQTCSV